MHVSDAVDDNAPTSADPCKSAAPAAEDLPLSRSGSVATALTASAALAAAASVQGRFGGHPGELCHEQPAIRREQLRQQESLKTRAVSSSGAAAACPQPATTTAAAVPPLPGPLPLGSVERRTRGSAALAAALSAHVQSAFGGGDAAAEDEDEAAGRGGEEEEQDETSFSGVSDRMRRLWGAEVWDLGAPAEERESPAAAWEIDEELDAMERSAEVHELLVVRLQALRR